MGIHLLILKYLLTMGAKFAKLMTPSATVNTSGLGCKVDADCTNGKGTTGEAKTAVAAITVAADIAKSCCFYMEYVKAPSGTAAEIAIGDLSLASPKLLGNTTCSVIPIIQAISRL